VTITGSNFTGATAVTFSGPEGTLAAQSFTVNSSTQITALTPAGFTDAVDVTVTTPAGTSATNPADQFTYAPLVPPPEDIYVLGGPTLGPTSGGTQVILTGINLSGATAVHFGSVNAASFTVVSSTEITAIAPAESPGVVDVTVTTPGGTSATSLDDRFTFCTYVPPTITGISPSYGPLGGGTAVTITGTNLGNVTAVQFGDVPATAFTIDSSTQITAVAPAGAPGNVNILLSAPDGGSAGGPFTYVAVPTVTNVYPDTGPAAGGTLIYITGTNFSGVTAVNIGGVTLSATSWTLQSATLITAITPAEAPGTVDITVSNPYYSSAPNAADQFTFIGTEPTVQTPASATPNPVTGTTTALNVLGADPGGEASLTYSWVEVSGPTSVSFSANGTNAAQNTTATFTKAGTYNFQVTITDPADLSVTSSVSVTVNQTLTSIAVTPATASVADGLSQAFSATGYDQFGNALTTQPAFIWSVTGAGSINGNVYSAPPAGTTTGSATVTARSGGVSGSAAVTVTADQPPTVVTAASASPNPVTGTTTNLSVLGADPQFASSTLTYSWTTTGTPPAPVTFSANGTNAAQNTTATFTAAGTYNFQATIADPAGLSVTSSVTVTVVGPSGSASFVKNDATTQGSWTSAYGSDGYDISQSSASLPAYAAVSIAGNANYVWNGATSDPRALQVPGSSSGLAACWYTPSTAAGASFTIDVNLTDGQTHQVALYALDWDGYGPRSERIDVLDTNGDVLDSRTLSSFQGGQYEVWDISGHVQFRITNLVNGSNAVISGLFFGGPVAASGSAQFVANDATTEGNWTSAYGGDGYDISQSSASLPTYAAVSIAGNANYVWNGATSDPRALQVPGSSSGLAACWYTPSTAAGASFTIDVNLTDGQTHQVALYALDWDGYGPRSERIDVLDTNGDVLDSRTLSSFQGGQYEVWDISGHVQFRITNLVNGSNAVISGIFFGGPSNQQFGTFSSLGGWVAQVVSARQANGDLVLFGIGGDHAVWENVQTSPGGAFSGWTSLGGWASQIAVATNQDGTLTVFAIGSDGAALANKQNSPTDPTFGGWYSLGGSGIQQLAPARDVNGNLDLFVIGSDNAVWFTTQSAANSLSFNGWTSLGGWTSQIAVATNQDGTLTVFAIGGDHAAWANKQNSPSDLSFGGWYSLGGWVEQLAVGLDAAGDVELFAIAGDSTVWERVQSSPDSGSFGGWSSLGGSAMQIAVGTNRDGTLAVFWDCRRRLGAGDRAEQRQRPRLGLVDEPGRLPDAAGGC
jgi:IPT/TIG domain